MNNNQNTNNNQNNNKNNDNKKDKSNNNDNSGTNEKGTGNKNNAGGTGGGDFKMDPLSRGLRILSNLTGLTKKSNGPGYTLESLCLVSHYRLLFFVFYASYGVVA